MKLSKGIVAVLLISVLFGSLFYGVWMWGFQSAQAQFGGVGTSMPKYNQINMPFSNLIDTNGTHYFLGNGTTWKWAYIDTNASKVFNFAIANATVQGGTVFVKVGNYIITNPILMRSNVNLLGEVRGSTTSKGSVLNIQLDVNNYAVQFNVTAIGASLSRSSIKNFGILSDTGHSDKALISVVSNVASGWRTSYTDIIDNDLIERTTDSPAIYLDQTDGNNLEISNNYIAGGTSTATSRNSNGIYIKSLDHGTISRNQIMYCKTYGIGKFETTSGTQLYYSDIFSNHIGYGFNQTASAINLNTTGSLLGVNIDYNWFELTDPAGNHFLDDWTVPIFALQSGTSGLKGDINVGDFNVVEYFGKTGRIYDMSQWVKIGTSGGGSVPNVIQAYEMTGAYYGVHFATIYIKTGTYGFNGEVRRIEATGNATVAAGSNSVTVDTKLFVDLGSISLISTNSTFTGTYYITKADDEFTLHTSTTGSGVWMWHATS